MQILGLLWMYFEAVVVFVTNSSPLLSLALAILWRSCWFFLILNWDKRYVCLTSSGLKPELNFNQSPDIFDHQFCRSQCTEVGFASFFSDWFNTAKVVNPPERKLAKRTSVQCAVANKTQWGESPFKLLHACHYKPRLVYFLTHFPCSFYRRAVSNTDFDILIYH